MFLSDKSYKYGNIRTNLYIFYITFYIFVIIASCAIS